MEKNHLQGAIDLSFAFLLVKSSFQYDDFFYKQQNEKHSTSKFFYSDFYLRHERRKRKLSFFILKGQSDLSESHILSVIFL
jgi:hypothetical protein